MTESKSLVSLFYFNVQPDVLWDEGSTLKYGHIGMRGVGLGDFNRGSLRGHFPLPQTHNHTARNCLYCWQLYTSQQGGRLCDFQIVQAASVLCCVVSVLYGTQCLCVLPCLACWGFPVCASTVKVIVVSTSLQRCSEWICPSCKVKAFKVVSLPWVYISICSLCTL